MHGGSVVKVGTVEVKTGKRLTTADMYGPVEVVIPGYGMLFGHKGQEG